MVVLEEVSKKPPIAPAIMFLALVITAVN